jgi:hypothetical protein
MKIIEYKIGLHFNRKKEAQLALFGLVYRNERFVYTPISLLNNVKQDYYEKYLSFVVNSDEKDYSLIATGESFTLSEKASKLLLLMFSVINISKRPTTTNERLLDYIVEFRDKDVDYWYAWLNKEKNKTIQALKILYT